MSNDRLLELLSRKLSGEATPEELLELHALLSADPEAAERYKILDQFWEKQDDSFRPAVEEGLQKLLSGLGLSSSAGIVNLRKRAAIVDLPKRKSRLKSIPPWLRGIAVMLVLLVGLAILLIHRPAATNTQVLASLLLEKHNSKGTKSTIQLTDGSKIWLNADSKIKYPEVFSGPTREIYLNGEAFFEVAKNPSHPFIIHLANGTVQVLGTSFNIRAYDNEMTVETSVTTGRVAFIPKYRNTRKKQDTVYLAPDHKARYTFTKEELSESLTSAMEDKAWTEGKLIFKSMTMEEIGIELERNFGKKVVFLDEAPKAFILTGSFRNNTLEEIMYYLSKTKNFQYKITNTELLIAGSSGRLQ